MFAPIPPWNGAHPIIVHLPLGVLLVAPLFVVLSLVWRRYARAFATSAFILMLIGTAGAFLAVESGEAADEYAEESLNLPEHVMEHVEEHEESGELSRNLFVGLTVLYFAVVILPVVWKPAASLKAQAGVSLVFLVLYVLGLGQLAHTGHLGGGLVHEHGIQAPMAAGDESGTLSAEHSDHEHDE